MDDRYVIDRSRLFNHILPTYHFTHVKPILRPMSDLTKEIIYRGEKFVPMVEIGKLLGYDNLEKYEIDGVIEYGFETRYADDAQGYTFGWHQARNRLAFGTTK